MKVTNNTGFTVVAYGMARERKDKGPKVAIRPGETVNVLGPYLGEMDGPCHLAILGELVCHDDPKGDQNSLVLLGEPLFIGNTVFQVHIFHHHDFLLLTFEEDLVCNVHSDRATVGRSPAGKEIIEIGRPLLGLIARRLKTLIDQAVDDRLALSKLNGWKILLGWLSQKHNIPVRHKLGANFAWISWCETNALPPDTAPSSAP